jgi:hypothetical protein
VLVLQHPLEAKRRLATVPLLLACFQPGCCLLMRHRVARKVPPLVAALQEAVADGVPVFLLFPGPGAPPGAGSAAADGRRDPTSGLCSKV